MFFKIVKDLKFQKTLTCWQTTDYSEKQTTFEYFGNQKNKCSSKNKFSFSIVEKKNVIRKEIDLLQINETAQCMEIPTKITKENFDLVSDFIQNLNDCIASSAFPTVLKWAAMLCKFTENIPRTQKNHRPGIFYQMFQKFIKSLSLIKCLGTLLLSLQNSSEILKWVAMLKIAYCQC